MDSITLHSSNMFVDLAHSLRWNPQRAARNVAITSEGQTVHMRGPTIPAYVPSSLQPVINDGNVASPADDCFAGLTAAPAGEEVVVMPMAAMEEVTGQGTALGVREYARSEVHSWVVRWVI